MWPRWHCGLETGECVQGHLGGTLVCGLAGPVKLFTCLVTNRCCRCPPPPSAHPGRLALLSLSLSQTCSRSENKTKQNKTGQTAVLLLRGWAGLLQPVLCGQKELSELSVTVLLRPREVRWDRLSSALAARGACVQSEGVARPVTAARGSCSAQRRGRHAPSPQSSFNVLVREVSFVIYLFA